MTIVLFSLCLSNEHFYQSTNSQSNLLLGWWLRYMQPHSSFMGLEQWHSKFVGFLAPRKRECDLKYKCKWWKISPTTYKMKSILSFSPIVKIRINLQWSLDKWQLPHINDVWNQIWIIVISKEQNFTLLKVKLLKFFSWENFKYTLDRTISQDQTILFLVKPKVSKN